MSSHLCKTYKARERIVLSRNYRKFKVLVLLGWSIECKVAAGQAGQITKGFVSSVKESRLYLGALGHH